MKRLRKVLIFNRNIAPIISRSLKTAVNTDNAKYLPDFNNILINYGWSNEMDDFVGALSYDALKSLLASMNDVFPKKQTPKFTGHKSIAPPMFSEFNKSAKDGNGNKRVLYNYTHWLVDRPVAPTSQPVQYFMDMLRHRLEITAISVESTASTSANGHQALKGWGKKKSIKPATTTTQTEPEPRAVSAPLPSDPPYPSSQYQTTYDVLINILNHSDILSQIELFRLLIERRTPIPLLLPLLNSETGSYDYLINALSFVTTKLSGQKEYNLGNDRSLLRIAILSMRPVKQSESSEWMKQVFSCHSLMLLSMSDAKSIPSNQCIAEIGIGFIPCSTNVESKERYKEVLVLNVIGNYSSIWSYIQKFADVLMVEEEPFSETSFQPLSPSRDACSQILWKTATHERAPIINKDAGWIRLSSSLHQTVHTVQDALIELLSDESNMDQHSPLMSIICSDIYTLMPINLFDTEKTIKEQDFYKVRLVEFPLQQLFLKESENIGLKNKNKNNDAEQQRYQRIIDECQKERQQKSYEVEQHPLIKCFSGILTLENGQLRTLSIHKITQQIEFHSRSAMKEFIEKKDEAFNEYDRDQQNDGKKRAYFDAKRLVSESSIGIEHFWREICHLYSSNPSRYDSFPVLAAKHLIDGFSLELLDGDAGMLEQTWIKAVFTQIEQQLMKQRDPASTNGPIRIFILSVLGVQSTGKSTLLNLMYGTRFPTSAGMCTRGVNMQLLKAENREEYDYILILDTEGIRAPELTGLADSKWRDNRMATFAVLPADATIIMVNSEDDSAVREVLPIVMLAYQQSELAASSTSQLSTRMFFVYTRVDMSDTKKLVNNIQAMFMDVTENARKLQKGPEISDDRKGNAMLFRDFRVKANDGDIGGKDSDIKFLGKVRKSDMPPDDVPDTDYGKLAIQINDYIYRRVVSKSSDGQQWRARELRAFAPHLDAIWQCIVSVDFTLSFKSVMERMTYDQLQTYCVSQRTELARLFSKAYDEIEVKIIGEKLPDQKHSKQQEEELCAKTIQKYQAQLSRAIDTDATAINERVLQELNDRVCLYIRRKLRFLKIFRN